MSFTAIAPPSQPGVFHAYLTSVGTAARALVAALLAIKPRQSSAATAICQQEVSSRESVKNMAALQRMANQYDAAMPNFSAELRYLASRG